MTLTGESQLTERNGTNRTWQAFLAVMVQLRRTAVSGLAVIGAALFAVLTLLLGVTLALIAMGVSGLGRLRASMGGREKGKTDPVARGWTLDQA